MKLAMAQISMLNNMNANYRKTLQYIEQAAGAICSFSRSCSCHRIFRRFPGWMRRWR